jgi:hypothetical protein
MSRQQAKGILQVTAKMMTGSIVIVSMRMRLLKVLIRRTGKWKTLNCQATTEAISQERASHFKTE